MMRPVACLKWALGWALLIASMGFVQAQNIDLVTASATKAGTVYSVPVQTLLILTALSFLPAALMLMTSFTRILIVFSLLRQALGLQGMPPNMVLIGLSFLLTLFVMNPVLEPIYKDAYLPLTRGELNLDQAVEKATVPLKSFMLKQTRQDDLNLFAKLHHKPIATRADVPMTVLVPAFAISEIKTGFFP